MNELIKIEQKDGKQIVSARELHHGLDIKTPFRSWFPRMCEYGFEENVDYTPYIFVHPQNKQQITEYAITIDMAKEISMIQRSDLGKKFRQYFIECEKQLLQINEKDKLLVGLFSADPMVVAQSHKALIELEVKPFVQQIVQKQTVIDSVIKDDGLFAVGDVGKMLKPYCSIMGAKKIFDFMRSQKIVFDEPSSHKHNLPYSQYEKHFNIKVVDKGDRSYYKCYFTGKGLKWFLNTLVKHGYMTCEQKQSAEENFK